MPGFSTRDEMEYRQFSSLTRSPRACERSCRFSSICLRSSISLLSSFRDAVIFLKLSVILLKELASSPISSFDFTIILLSRLPPPITAAVSFKIFRGFEMERERYNAMTMERIKLIMIRIKTTCLLSFNKTCVRLLTELIVSVEASRASLYRAPLLLI